MKRVLVVEDDAAILVRRHGSEDEKLVVVVEVLEDRGDVLGRDLAQDGRQVFGIGCADPEQRGKILAQRSRSIWISCTFRH